MSTQDNQKGDLMLHNFLQFRTISIVPLWADEKIKQIADNVVGDLFY